MPESHSAMATEIARLHEQISAMRDERANADAAWQSAESRLVRICQLLHVDYTCEEPETCEQVIERLCGHVAAMREAIVHWHETTCIPLTSLRDCEKVLIASVTSDAGKQAAEVIAAAIRGSEACSKQYAPQEEPCCGMCIWQACCEAVRRMKKDGKGAVENARTTSGDPMSVIEAVRHFKFETRHHVITGTLAGREARQALFDTLDRFDGKSTNAEQAKMDDETIQRAIGERRPTHRCRQCGARIRMDDPDGPAPRCTCGIDMDRLT